MRVSMYAIFDTAAAVAPRPFLARTEAEAVRGFQGLVLNADTVEGQHPEHFTLMHIAEYDDSTMKVEPVDPRSVVTGLAVVAQSQQPIQAQEVDNAH